ncbi:Exocyst complex component 7 [Blomia tropicalis]|nr:Exocyst complex component 7 [Blomia tropicalis]
MIELEDDKKKLWTATRSLERLKKLLTDSNGNCSKMGEILTHFDDRLSKLEETVQPVYKETGNLQKQQDNIMSSLGRLDYVIKFYTVAGEVESSIASGPGATSFDLYLHDLDRLTEAVRYFECNNPDCPEMMNVSSLLDKGGSNIEKEFRTLLTRHSSPIPISNVLELINSTGNQDSSIANNNNNNNRTSSSSMNVSSPEKTQRDATSKIIEKNVEIQLPEKSRNELALLSEWLCMNRNDDFIAVYSLIRSDVLLKSLNALRSYLKSSSLGTVINSGNNLGINISPLLGGRRNLHLSKTDTLQFRRSSMMPDSSTPTGTKQGLIRRLQDVGMDMLSGGAAKDGYKFQQNVGNQSQSFDPSENIVSERDIMSYVTSVTGLFKLMQLELKLLEAIIPQNVQRKIFSRLVIRALDSVYQEGESLSSRVKRCVQSKDFSSALCLLPVLRYHAYMRHSFDILLDGCEPEVQNKLHSLVVTLQTTISKSLEEFIDYIKSDAHRLVPKDGTVHELTSNVMLFLVHLHSYLDILSRVVTVTDMRAMEMCNDKNRFAFAQYIFRVLIGLELTIEKKSELYNHDETLKSLFKLNNTFYILKTLRKSHLLEIVSLYPRSKDFERTYEDKIDRYKLKYLETWNRVLQHVLEMNNPISQQRTIASPHYNSTLPHSQSMNYNLSQAASSSFRLKDKDRQHIKEKFSGFNKEFEAIHNAQMNYAIPDPELRDQLKRENVNLIVPKYNLFYDKYVVMDFTKNVHKYIKYTPDHVAQKISSFFDSAA